VIYINFGSNQKQERTEMTTTSDAARPGFLTGALDWFDQLPQWGKIALMVGGFIVIWPIGLAILGYMIWSGQMGCRQHKRGWKREHWGGGFRGRHSSSGNMAFDEYRDATLRQLEEDQREFTAFLDKLRRAKDQREFDDFMADRMRRKTEENGRPRPEDQQPSAD
jgi:hypothetical protein